MAKYKLLFVDDEANILKALKRLLFKNHDPKGVGICRA